MTMDNVADLTVEILRQIRDEISGLRGDVGRLEQGQTETNARIDQTNARLERLDQGQTSLKAELVTQGLKTAQGFIDVAHELDGIRHLLADALALDERVEAIEDRLDRAGIGR